jgi:hypothetical protein
MICLQRAVMANSFALKTGKIKMTTVLILMQNVVCKKTISGSFPQELCAYQAC